MPEERIAKVIARAGVCSRREAEKLIEEGRVAVNDMIVESPALNVSEIDRITIDNKPLPNKEKTRLWLFHKPSGVITTNSDPQGRPTMFDLLPDNFPRVMTVGRLDINTEGLILLTNDGELARKLELPSNGFKRTYKVRVFGNIDEKKLRDLQKGVTIDGINYGPIDAELERHSRGKNHWITMTITEGKNREIRRICAHLGLQVSRLIRISYGPFSLGSMATEAIVEVKNLDLINNVG